MQIFERQKYKYIFIFCPYLFLFLAILQRKALSIYALVSNKNFFLNLFSKKKNNIAIQTPDNTHVVGYTINIISRQGFKGYTTVIQKILKRQVNTKLTSMGVVENPIPRSPAVKIVIPTTRK